MIEDNKRVNKGDNKGENKEENKEEYKGDKPEKEVLLKVVICKRGQPCESLQLSSI